MSKKSKSTKTTKEGGASPVTKTPKPPKPAKEKKVSGLDAAAQVLKASGGPMRCKDMMDAVLAQGLWKTRGKTSAATLYSAILREINTKKAASRFKKTERGLFVSNG